MWCSDCQQDVPGVASNDDDGRICCARCAGSISSGIGPLPEKTPAEVDSDEAVAVSDSLAEEPEPAEAAGVNQPPTVINDWQFEEELQAVDRLLRSLRSAGVITGTTEAVSERLAAVDAAHATAPEWHLPTARSPKKPPSNSASDSKQKKSRGPIHGLITWTLLSLGTMTFVCGAVLLGWAYAASRDQLWSIGMPLTLGGQALLLISLLFQLENLWSSNRETSSTLGDLDEQLSELRHATGMLSTTHSAHAQSFYAHMASGANSEMLLADLKGQLDMLTTKIASERR